jgi:FAD/FMN-containing dehydrogenase
VNVQYSNLGRKIYLKLPSAHYPSRQATITLASGETLAISPKPDENSDLFWAIRGAGSNFGVISEFVFRLHPQRKDVYSGILVFPVEMVDEVCRVGNAWWNEDGKGKGDKKGPSGKERLFINTAWSEELKEVGAIVTYQ